MRPIAAALALATLLTLSAVWSGVACTGLSGDCELNLTCPGTSSSSSSGGADAGDGGESCHGVFAAGDCDTCLQGSCCQAIIDCKDDPNCLYCEDAPTQNDPKCTSTATQKAVNALIGCEDLHCSGACVATDECNPVTNNGCDTDGGTACDLGFDPDTFDCYPPPNAATLCGACDNTNGPYCGPGLHCYFETCARYCCSDADCGSGVCELDVQVAFGGAVPAGDLVGICVTALVPDGGTGGPDGGSDSTSACDAPATSVSLGACFAGYSAM